MKEGSEGDGSTSDSKDSESTTTTSGILYSNSHSRLIASHINHANNIRSPLAITTTNGGNGGGVGTVSPGQPLLRALAESTRNQAMGATLAAIGAEVAAAAAAAASTTDHPSLSPMGGSFATALLGVTKKNSTGRRSRAASSGNGGSSAGEETNGNGNGGLVSKGKPMSATPPPDQSSPSPGSVAGVPPGGAPRDKVFVCGVCNRCFGYKHVLQNHERTHTGEKPFECKECHKRFTRDHHLKTHMRLHTGEKPYHCTHCERQFVQVANLRRHLRVHTGERPYACELCSSRFSDSNQLKAHMLIHKGEKPFECKKCLGRFRRRHHLMHHKCPKEELNLGKPRRGRRPKAYDSVSPHARYAGAAAAVTAFPTSVAVREPPLAIRPGEMASLGSLPPGAKTNCSRSSTPGIGKALPGGGGGAAVTASVQQPPLAHSSSGVVEKNNRRKPAHTVRILTPQQRELFLRDKETMQTQAIDMSLSPTPDSGALALLRRTGSASSRYGPSSTMEGVLDLSNSRSDDSEAEPIEEEIDDAEEEELMDEELYDEEDDELMDLESTGGPMGGSEDESRNAMASIRAATLKAVRIAAGSSSWEKATATVIHNHHHLHHREDNNQSPHRLHARDNGDLA